MKNNGREHYFKGLHEAQTELTWEREKGKLEHAYRKCFNKEKQDTNKQ